MIHRLPMPEAYGALFVCPAEGSAKAQHETAYRLLEECLPVYAEKHQLRIPELSSMLRTKMGKPYFPDVPELHFNLSHCDGLAVCLLSTYECGVDAEACRPLREKVVRRVFSPEEQEALQASDAPDSLFTALWTLKESYVKAIGIGISYPMREVCFRLEENGIWSNRKEAVFWHSAENGFSVSACIIVRTPSVHSSP